MESLDPPQRISYIVHFWARECEAPHIPEVLEAIFQKYAKCLSPVPPFFRNPPFFSQTKIGGTKFDLYNPNLVEVSNHGTVVRKKGDHGSYVLCGSSKGFDRGIHEVSVKMHKKCDNNCLGLCTKINTLNIEKSTEWIGCLAVEGFSTYTDLGILSASANSILPGNRILKGKWKGFKEGDVVKMIINCENWSTEYFVNDKFQVRVSMVVENVKYYPIMGFDSTGGLFHCEVVDI